MIFKEVRNEPKAVGHSTTMWLKLFIGNFKFPCLPHLDVAFFSKYDSYFCCVIFHTPLFLRVTNGSQTACHTISGHIIL